jgi:hypothetical protein
MENDARFLASNNLMDYSLLVGVKKRRFAVQRGSERIAKRGSFPQALVGVERSKSNSTEGAAESSLSGSELPLTSESNAPLDELRGETGGIGAAIVEGPEEYWFAIIDVLQEWNLSKQMESVTKQVLKGADPDGISAVPADDYCERFLERVAFDTFDDSIDDAYLATVGDQGTDADTGADKSPSSEGEKAAK